MARVSSTSAEEVFASNRSIDKVVSQIERISGRINDLVLSSKQQVDGMIGHGAATVSEFNKHFSVGKEGVDTLIGLLDTKFGGFPINALYVLLIISLCFLVIFLLFIMTAGSERISSRYQRLRTKRIQKKQATLDATP